MKQIVAISVALLVGILLAYYGYGTYIDRYFKGRMIDIMIAILIICLIIATVAAGLQIADWFFNIFPE